MAEFVIKPGMLYDCRNDTFLPGLTLWTFDALDGNITRNEQEHAEFEIITADHWGLTAHTVFPCFTDFLKTQIH